MTEDFIVTDLSGNTIVNRPSIELIMLWIQEHAYFKEHPERILSLTELFTRSFEVKITADTTLRELQKAWKDFNLYI